MCTRGGGWRGGRQDLTARGTPASAAFHLRSLCTGPAGRSGTGAAAPPTRAPRQGPRGPSAAAGFGSLRGAAGGLALPHRSRGAGWAGEAKAVPAAGPFPAQTLGRCPRRAGGGREEQRSRSGRCLSRAVAVGGTGSRQSRVSRAGVSGAVRRRDGKGRGHPNLLLFLPRTARCVE